QFDDLETGNFFMRIGFISEEGRGRDELAAGFGATAKAFGMDAAFHDDAERMKVVIMVSRFGHCLNDLLYRWRIGALKMDVVAVVSNHCDYRAFVEGRGIPFHLIEVNEANKPEAEAR